MSEMWKMTQLGAIADITMGQSPDSSSYNTDEIGLPFLQGCAEFGTRYPNPEVHCSPPLRVAKKDSLLISVRAPVGKMSWSDQDYCIGRGLGSIRAKASLANTHFLRHALDQNIFFLHRRSQGSTFLAVGANDLKLFPIPDISERIQEKIAAIINIIDQAIEKTEALIHKYQQIKAGLMHDLFTRGLTADGKLRPPREQAPDLYQETPIGWIPKEWEVKKVGDLCLSIVPGRDKPILDRGDLPWITVSDIELLYVFESIEGLSLSRSSLKKAHGRIIPKGAVVMSCVGSFGLVALTGKELVINQQLHAFVVGDQIIPEWLVFNLERQKRYMEKIATQTTILYLNKDACESVPIVVPSKKEQQHLVEKIKSISDQIFVEQQVALKLNKQKSGLMHDLLTGKVPVTIDQEETVHGS